MNESTAYFFNHETVQAPISRAVKELGFETMTPIQAQAIPFLMEGRDVIGQAQTGTGKTAAFGIPMLQKIDPDNKDIQALILCPTRELAVQAANGLRSFAKYMQGVKVLPVYGGQNIQLQIRGLKNTQIVVGTPGRVMDHMRRKTIRLDHLSMVVLDEADEMLNMGFREDMEVILGAVKHPHQTCLFSATMPQAILDITHMFLHDPEYIKITKKELTTELIQQYYYPVRREYKMQAAERILLKYRYSRSIIFCNTKHMVDELATALQKRGFTAEGLHGDLSQKQRDLAMDRFRGGALQILIATDIAARGIDVDDVEAVINFDIPQESEYYVHRIGRTGRAGKEGVSHTLCTSREFSKIREIEQICHTKMEERSIPTPEEITEALENKSLNSALAILSEGKSGRLIPAVRTFCETYQISAEELAAAYLKKELGDDLENLPMDLPAKPQRRPRRHENFRREERRDRHFSERSDHKDKKEKYHEKAKDFKKKKANRQDSHTPEHMNRKMSAGKKRHQEEVARAFQALKKMQKGKSRNRT